MNVVVETPVASGIDENRHCVKTALAFQKSPKNPTQLPKTTPNLGVLPKKGHPPGLTHRLGKDTTRLKNHQKGNLNHRLSTIPMLKRTTISRLCPRGGMFPQNHLQESATGVGAENADEPAQMRDGVRRQTDAGETRQREPNAPHDHPDGQENDHHDKTTKNQHQYASKTKGFRLLEAAADALNRAH